MKQVALITLLHLIALAALYSPTPPPVDKTPLAVRTFELKAPPKQPEVNKIAQNLPAAKPLPKKTPIIQPKAPTVQPKAPTIQSKASTKKEKLISFLKEQKTTETAQKKLETLSSENLKIQTAYQEELVLYLQTLLTLPEKGNVKLKCTLDRSGTVQSLQILAAASEQNRRYIEDSLFKLALPSFGSHFPNQTTHTFVLSLTSENCH
ncbi:MAG: hypothetical protein S4CHLAM123_13950 [Chlamydiales bacterium]|nr:hypothetical protein [Chlamydiales bacterium]